MVIKEAIRHWPCNKDTS